MEHPGTFAGAGTIADNFGVLGPESPEALFDGRFVLRELLGRGGMGSVWRAIDLQSSNEVAIKLLDGEAALNPRTMERFEREVAVLAGLDHPNIVRLLAANLRHARPYFVQELVTGVSLETELRVRAYGRDPFTMREVLLLIGGVARALEHAHRRGVMHRDVKPSNVLIPLDSSDDIAAVKLADFGIAKLFTHEASEATTVGRFIGTPSHLAPERIHSPATEDARGDVFCLGLLLFEALTLRRPFFHDDDGSPAPFDRDLDERDRVAVFQRILCGPRPRVSDFASRVPRAIDDLVCAALAPDPADRPASASLFLSELEETLELTFDAEKLGSTKFARATIAMERTRTAARTTSSRPRRSLVAGGIAVATGALSIASLLLFSSLESPSIAQRNIEVPRARPARIGVQATNASSTSLTPPVNVKPVPRERARTHGQTDLTSTAGAKVASREPSLDELHALALREIADRTAEPERSRLRRRISLSWIARDRDGYRRLLEELKERGH